ncbi:DsbA family protein [Gordonia insulae]|uniref:Serine/threonine-protein kinase PknE n=1 Tax=Gordonia insulae TaxID=2420509 RepID=A0A3G8JU01_9ACTN|nr:thioredoxin domain-containing protein [Gordonia insulae]AZG48634.1 Serine/threonine-protein kinase PknE [Gordonia insulae]
MSDKRKPTPPKSATSKYQPSATSSRTTYVLAGAAVIIVAALVIGGVIWNTQRDSGGVDDAVLSENAALIIGAPAAPQTIDVFEDFMCPVCREFEQQSGASITKAINDGTLRVRYHMLTFLDEQSSSGDYSSRAAGAAQCVGSGEDKEVFLKFHSALFADQPSEGGSSDLSNADLARIAGEQGASDATQKCIADGAKVDEAKQAAEQSQTQLAKATGGQVGTPTVLSGGQPVDGIMSGTGWLDQLLADKG